MLEAQTRFLRQIYRVMILGKMRMHFLACYCPEQPAGSRLNLYLIFAGAGEKDAYGGKLRKVIASSGIAAYFGFEERGEEVLTGRAYTQMAVMHKKERVLQTVLDSEEKFFYVIPGWEVNEKNRLLGLYKLMESFHESCCYRVDLYPEEDLEEEIHQAFERPLAYLRNVSRTVRGISELSKIQQEKRDPNAEETLRQYEDWLKEVDAAPVFLSKVCAFSDDRSYSQLLLDSAVSESLKKGNARFIARQGRFSPVSEGERYTPYCSDGIPKSMQKWATTFTLDEAAAFMRLPVLYDGETIELPKETVAVRESGGLRLGRDTGGYDVMLPLSVLTKHMFVCGMPGSGKTNTMLHLADSLWRHHIPFLVLEPAKREYRELALSDIPELLIFSPSACTDFPIRLNPFEFPAGLSVSEHINRLCQVFEGAFPMAPPAPFILDRAIQKIYENHGWSMKEINTGSRTYPTLSELYGQFERELENTRYDGEIRGNIQSVLEMRIGSLLRREMKDMFDVPRSILAPEEWLKYPVIIELEALGEGVANFVTLLLCALIRETLKVSPGGDGERPVRHVIFIEEAHNLIAPEAQVKDQQDSNPKIAATAFIVQMLAEVRALREGLVIADQLPTAMAPEVIKNTNVKLVHRLSSGDDRELIGNTMLASPLQVENIASYTSGQALIIYEKLLRPFEMQVCRVENHEEKPPDDRKLLGLMLEKPAYTALRKSMEEEAFVRLKEKTMAAVKLERESLQPLRDCDLRRMSPEAVRQWGYAVSGIMNQLETLRLQLTREGESLEEMFLERGRKEELMEIIGCIGQRLEKIINKAVRTM